MEIKRKTVALILSVIICFFSFSGCGMRNPKEGDIIKYGSYCGEEIEWIVLAKDGNKVLLLSRYVIDARAYDEENDEIKWEDCSLREWMNDDFYYDAFGPLERRNIAKIETNEKDDGTVIEDKVFLLNKNEIEKYFSSDEDRWTRLTLSVLDNGYDFVVGVDGTCSYWINQFDPDSTVPCFVGPNGKIYDSEKRYGFRPTDELGVRPAIWVDYNLLSFFA